METIPIPDVVIILLKSDLKRADKAIAAVASEFNVRPTKTVFIGDQIKICYRPWHAEVFREAFEKAS